MNDTINDINIGNNILIEKKTNQTENGKKLTEFKYKNIDYYLCCAYISCSAINKVIYNNKCEKRIQNNKYLKNIKTFNNTEVIQNFTKESNKYINDNIKLISKKYDLYNKNEIIKTLKDIICNKSKFNISQISFQCIENLTPIYFDHKVADYVSVFQKLIYYGSYPTTGKCEFIPLIKGDHLKTNIEKKMMNNHCVKIIKHMEEYYEPDEIKKDSKTFYKNINYILNDSNINNRYDINDLLDIINSNQNGGSNNIKSKSKKSKLRNKSKNKSNKIRKSKKLRNKSNKLRKSNKKNK